MVGINLLNYLDRYVAAAVAPQIQDELHLSNSEVGLFGTAFLLVYAIAAIPFGYWGDRGVRKTVIGVGVTIWSLATLLTGFARNYVQLFLSRAVVGIGEASYYPAGTSLLSDYFPKEQRARVMSIWGAGSTIGIAIGYAGGGYIADKLGWRAAFFIAGVPGLIVAFLAFQMREPLRGAVERAGPRAGQDRRGQPPQVRRPAQDSHPAGDDHRPDASLLRPRLQRLLAPYRPPAQVRDELDPGRIAGRRRHRGRRPDRHPRRRLAGGSPRA